MDTTETSPIFRLPLHLVVECLTFLTTGQQLGSAILSHRIFYEAFKRCEKSVTRNVATQVMAVEVLPFAIARFKVPDIATGDEDAARAILKQMEVGILNPHEAALDALRLSDSDMNVLAQTHDVVKSLTQHFVQETLPIFTQSLQPYGFHRNMSVSKTEEIRIARAFYRYQLICDLYVCGTDLNVSDEEWRRLLFEPFSFWVHEQVVCIHHYLMRKAVTAFADVAAHDVECAYARIDCRDVKDHAFSHRPLVKGLGFLRDLIEAETFGQKYLLLVPDDDFDILDVEDYPVNRLREKRLNDFLLNIQDQRSLVSLGGDTMNRLVGRLDGKLDSRRSGPFQMWLATHGKGTLRDLVASAQKECIMDRGYAIWDDTGLEYLDLADATRAMQLEPPLIPKGYYKDWTAWRYTFSMVERKTIRENGGYGYWPSGERYDFSRIEGLTDNQAQYMAERWDFYKPVLAGILGFKFRREEPYRTLEEMFEEAGVPQTYMLP